MHLQGVFEGIVGADSMGEVCKPEQAAFQRAIDICGADPKATVMFEDSFKNLRTAKELGQDPPPLHLSLLHYGFQFSGL